MMSPSQAALTPPRRFLLLQGPHGPFFSQLGRMLRHAGAQVWRVGFNGGDRAFWRGPERYLAFDGAPGDWPDWVGGRITDLGITDLVLYGEPRPIHAQALRLARTLGLRTHIFEEGYLRPYWVTYERDGANGNSRLMDMTVPQMLAALGQNATDLPEAPAHWGEMRQHVLYGALYHAAVMAGGSAYPSFRPHRNVSVGHELQLHLRRLALMPLHHVRRTLSARRLKRGGFPYHLVLLQLEHDASFQSHSSFTSMTQFLDLVLSGFVAGAPGHHHIVFKAHPLEDGRAPLAREIRRIATDLGIADRVHFQIGGKLAPLLDSAATAITVNSTAAQQALWRGLPVKAFGRAVYSKPEFVSDQPLPAFLSNPDRPDLAAYRGYRQFLLMTSQIRGGFYSSNGRRTLLRQIVDLMLAEQCPYDRLLSPGAAPRQQIRLIL
jgi:capsular polysaccharide export protein